MTGWQHRFGADLAATQLDHTSSPPSSGSPAPLIHDELVERAQTDPEAFGELYRMHVRRIHTFVYAQVRNRHLAEDITADVFLRALQSIPRYQARGIPFIAWLYRIAANAVVDHHRAARYRAEPLAAAVRMGSVGTSPEDAVADHDEAARVWEVIETLPACWRIALTLRFRHDLRFVDVGARMGRSEMAAKLLVHRGLQALRRRLGVVGGGAGDEPRRVAA